MREIETQHSESSGTQYLSVPGLEQSIRSLGARYPRLTTAAIARILHLPRRVIEAASISAGFHNATSLRQD